MKCLGIELVDFRNIERASVRFGEGVTVLYGDNAQLLREPPTITIT